MEKKIISKKDFEYELVSKYRGGLSKSKVREEATENKVNIVTCYYDKNKHIATWCNGKGWHLN